MEGVAHPNCGHPSTKTQTLIVGKYAHFKFSAYMTSKHISIILPKTMHLFTKVTFSRLFFIININNNKQLLIYYKWAIPTPSVNTLFHKKVPTNCNKRSSTSFYISTIFQHTHCSPHQIQVHRIIKSTFSGPPQWSSIFLPFQDPNTKSPNFPATHQIRLKNGKHITLQQ